MLYSELRAEMRHKGVQSSDIARWIDRSEIYVSRRMTGAAPWTQTEMYTIMYKLHIPLHKMHIAFPQGGAWAGALQDPPPDIEQQMLTVLKQFVREAAT